MTAGLIVSVFSELGFLLIVLRACAVMDRTRFCSVSHYKRLAGKRVIVSELDLKMRYEAVSYLVVCKVSSEGLGRGLFGILSTSCNSHSTTVQE
jgi:hypothetical protein